MKKYDVIVIGAGFAGSILAYKVATELNKKVLVVEKRNHIAGNMFDYVVNDIRVQKYGPHTFHTNMDEVYEFISKFCVLDKYNLKCEAIIDGVSTPTPFNFKTIDQFYSCIDAKKLKKRLIERFGAEQATVLEMLECDDEVIRDYAKFLFKKDYSLYTAKQWGKKPEEIDPSILKRVPIIFNYRDTYFTDKYEGIPKDGFVSIFDNMLSNDNIDILLETDALKHISFKENKITYNNEVLPIVYTGPIDELFDYKFGKLPYRSLWFDYKFLNRKSYQNVAIVAHPQDMECTRITEYTKLPYQDVGEKTLIALEYSLEYDKNADKGNEPYYPVLTEESMKQYNEYLQLSKKFENLILCGRLAEFKYYNMDIVIKRALDVFKESYNILARS